MSGCVVDPLIEPDKQNWLECSKGFAKTNFITGLVIVIILAIMVIGIQFAVGAGAITVGITSGLALLFLFGVIYTYQVSDQTADRNWEDAKSKISRKMDNPNAFDNYANEEPEKKNELRRQWIKHGEELQEIAREEARTQAMNNMSHNNRYDRYGRYGRRNSGINLHF
jgi:hypothetical protein